MPLCTRQRPINRVSYSASGGGGGNAYDPAPTPNGFDLYLSPSGNDANAGTLASPKQNLSAVPWSTLGAGVAVWMRAGTYTWPDVRDLSTNGTANSRITISGYPSESVTINFTDAAYPQLCGGNYVDFRNFNITAQNHGFVMTGTNPGTGSGNPSYNIRFIDLTGTRSSVSFPDNSGLIELWGGGTSGSVDYIEVVRCDFSGPNASNNQALVWVDAMPHFKLIGTRLDGTASPLYFKHNHQCTLSSQVDVQIKNNIIANAGLTAQMSVSFAVITNNVWSNANPEFSVDGGNPGGDFNTFTHNTVYGTSSWLGMNPPQVPATSDLWLGTFQNVLRNNVFAGTVGYRDNSFNQPASFDNQTDTNYNAFTSGSSVIQRSSTNYSLASYKTAFSPKEANSVAGTIAFAVGSPNIATPSNWALGSGSVGLLAANDGANMGVDAIKLLTVN